MRSKGLLVPLLKQAYTLESCAIGLQHLTLLLITLLLAALDFSYFPFLPSGFFLAYFDLQPRNLGVLVLGVNCDLMGLSDNL